MHACTIVSDDSSCKLHLAMGLPTVIVYVTTLLAVQGQQQPIPKRLLEGQDGNTNIVCGVYVGHVFYWNINGLVYDLYSVPAVFTVTPDGTLWLKRADRRMDNWRLQCFTITGESTQNTGQITILRVHHNNGMHYS